MIELIRLDMTIAEWLEATKRRIGALDTELIALANFAPAGADRSWLVAHEDEEIGWQKAVADIDVVNVVKNTTILLEKAEQMVARRESGEPLAYILGEKEFYGRKFTVNPTVLIPRPETEALIELVLEVLGGRLGGDGCKVRSEQGLVKNDSGGLRMASGRQRVRILEVGTGSGCIAVTLALELLEAEVVATDVSLAALEVARGNVERLGAQVRLLQADLLEEVSESGPRNGAWSEQGLAETGRKRAENGPLGQKYDLIVANLPYVDPNWEWLERKTLDFEPGLALYAEKRGLALYERLLQQVTGMELADWLILEADPCQHAELIQMAVQKGWGVDKIVGFGLRLQRSDVS